MPYNRDEVVAAVTSYYEFLTGIHIPKEEIKYPPPGGWPELTDEYLSFMEKTPVVNDLIRHLPYIRHDKTEGYQIHENTTAADLTGENIRQWPQRVSVDTQDGLFDDFKDRPTPPHVFTLAHGGGRTGYWLMLDTETGYITMCNFSDEETEPTELSEDPDESNDPHWRCQATYTVPDLFEKLKQDFRSFNVAVFGETDEVDIDNLGEPWMSEIKEIYETHGWLTENYDRVNCLRKVGEVSDRALGF